MAITLYADLPARRARQLLADLSAVVWICCWGYAARVVHDSIAALRGPTDTVRDAGNTFASQMTSAADQLSSLPFIGDRLKAPFEGLTGTGQTIAQAGTDFGVAVDRAALAVGLVTFLLPLALALVLWVPPRLIFIRRATAARKFIDAEADVDLFAMRALARQPMHRLARLSDDPAGAWRRREPQVVRALAELELRDCGLQLPSSLPPA